MTRCVHHMDFVVHDLDAAIDRFRVVFDLEPMPRERLETRGIELVRFDLGGVWIILVQPVREDSPVADFLERHGEGFFHLALGVDDVEAEAERLHRAGVRTTTDRPRRGVEGWRLVDLEMADTFGVMIQLAEVTDARGE